MDEDVLVSCPSLSVGDIIDVIGSLREQLYTWYWTGTNGTGTGTGIIGDNGTGTGTIGFPQRVAIGLADKKSSACYDPSKNMHSSCGVEMLHTFMNAVETIENMSVCPDLEESDPSVQPGRSGLSHMKLLENYYHIYIVMKVYNQLYVRCSRRAVLKSIGTGSGSGLNMGTNMDLDSLLSSEHLWLWRNTYTITPSTSTSNSNTPNDSSGIVVNTVLVPPASLVGGGSKTNYPLDYRIEGTSTHNNDPGAEMEADTNSSSNDYSPTVSHDTLQYSVGYSPLSGSTSLPDDPFNEQFYIAGGRGKNTVKVSHGAAALLKGVLIMIPQVIPFQVRVSIFECLIGVDKSAVLGNDPYGLNQYLGNNRNSRNSNTGPLKLEVRRTHIVEDAYTSLQSTLPSNSQSIVQGDRMKNKIHIEFVSEQGHLERGIDGGGLFKVSVYIVEYWCILGY